MGRRRRGRVRRGPTLGGLGGSWRWELGVPLMVIGGILAGYTIAAPAGGLLFWIGVAIGAVGAALAARPP